MAVGSRKAQGGGASVLRCFSKPMVWKMYLTAEYAEYAEGARGRKAGASVFRWAVEIKTSTDSVARAFLAIPSAQTSDFGLILGLCGLTEDLRGVRDGIAGHKKSPRNSELKPDL